VLLADTRPGVDVRRPAAFRPHAPTPKQPCPSPASAARRVEETSARAYAGTLLHTLQSDTSRLALRPADPSILEDMVNSVLGAADQGTPGSTGRKDAGHWRKWAAFCALLNTDPWRTDAAANNGSDTAGHVRETFLQTAFLVYTYTRMRPRRRNDPAAKPCSANKVLQAVRRVHAKRNITMAKPPSVAKALRGLYANYVRLHGVESLIPHRKEPLTNEYAAAIIALARSEATATGGRRRYSPDQVTCFVALLTTLRHRGARKADLIPVTADEFDGRHMSRRHVKWHINGVVYDDPTPEQLRSLGDGDHAVVSPAASKADQFGLAFADRPAWLPVVPGDPLNAALALAALELDMPVRGAARKATPLFTSSAALRSMQHSEADSMFADLATRALGKKVAATLSLHSGRVWLACALLARNRPDGHIQALCNWKSAESVRIYARLQWHEYSAILKDAMNATVDPSLVRSLPVTDADAAVLRLWRDTQASVRAAQRAASPAEPAHAAPPPTTTADNDDDDVSDDDSDIDDDKPATVTAGALMGDDAVCVGARAAVPFRVDGVESHCAGRIAALLSNGRSRVEFDDGETWEVDRARLFSIAS